MKIDPRAWRFEVTDEQRERIGQAYVAFQAAHGHQVVPDVKNLVAQVTLGFGGSVAEIVRFWERDFVSDVPGDYADLQGSARQQIEDHWRGRKLRHIVRELGMVPLVAWDRRSLNASLRSPEGLQEVGAALHKLEEEGFALTSIEPENPDLEDDAVVTWHLSKVRDSDDDEEI